MIQALHFLVAFLIFLSPPPKSCPVSVLLVAAEPPGRPGFVADVQSKLLATLAFTTVDVFDAYTATPSLSTLQPYSAVLTWCSFPYYDGSGLGDVLAQCWDGGGDVVVATHANTLSNLRGRFGTNENGYILIEGSTNQEIPQDSLGTVIEPESRLMAGVAYLAASNAVRSMGEVINGGVVVARWASNGRPLVVRGSKAGRPLVALNMWPPSSSVAGNSPQGILCSFIIEFPRFCSFISVSCGFLVNIWETIQITDTSWKMCAYLRSWDILSETSPTGGSSISVCISCLPGSYSSTTSERYSPSRLPF